MELFKLDADYLPGETIKQFDTLVWTERYLTAGEFKLIVENDLTTLKTLPVGTLISHTGTHEVAVVEDYEIETVDKTLTLTLTGRMFETFGENRVTNGSLEPVNDGSGNAIIEVLSGMSTAEVAEALFKYGLEPGTATTDDEVPNLLVVKTVVFEDDPADYQVQRGDIYTRALEFLTVGGCGIKTRRPNGAQTTLDLVIHDGVDRTETVIFYAQNQDLTDAKYFGSIRKKRNYAQISGKTATRLYRDRNLGVDLTGLDRRVIYEEASDLEGAFSPPSDTDELASRAQRVIDSRRTLSIMQATISENAKPKYKFDYDIGDVVTVFGDFNVTSAMRVTEHILTIDKDGIKTFPSLSAI